LETSIPANQTKRVVEILKEIRLAKGLSQAKLAKAAKIGRPTVSHLESGYRSPTLLICFSIANALGVSLGKVLLDAESRRKPHEEN